MSTISGQQLSVFVSRFDSDYELIRFLGKGGFGTVVQAKNKNDVSQFKIRMLNLNTSGMITLNVLTWKHNCFKGKYCYVLEWTEILLYLH
jgi:serine/threonine protein kinase